MKRGYRHWTAEETATLTAAWGWQPEVEIARRLRRTRASVHGKAVALGLRLDGPCGRYAAGAVARIFAVDQSIVATWVKRGWLVGRQWTPRGRWDIRHEAIAAFIQDHSDAYDRRRISDTYWRELADAATEDMVSALQASRMLGVCRRVVQSYLQAGVLRGTRHRHLRTSAWRIARADVLAFRDARRGVAA